MDPVTYTFVLPNITFAAGEYDISAIAENPQKFFDVMNPASCVLSLTVRLS